MASLLQSSYGYKSLPASKPFPTPPIHYYTTPPITPAQGPQPAGGPAATMTLPGGPPPDYASMALNDPIYQSFLSNRNLDIGSAGTSRRAALQALALGYGGLPPGQTDEYGDLTPDILAQGQANSESTLAQLQRSYDAQNVAMQNQLAARGALHSGDLVAGQQALDTQLQSNQYGAAQGFGDQLRSAIDAYTGAVSAANAGQPAALQAAIQNQENTYTPPPDQTAKLVADWQNNFGRPMYTAANGDLYTPDPGTGALVLYASVDPNDPTGYVYTGV